MPQISPRLMMLSSSLIAALILAGLVYSIGQHERESRTSATRELLDNRLGEELVVVEGMLSRIADDTLFLSALPPIDGIVRASANDQGIDELGQSSLEVWRSRLNAIFTAYMRAHPHITQLRYIGTADSGREIVRVDRVEDRIVVRTPNEMQQKGSRPYFIGSVSVQLGTVYFSKIELNRDHGVLQRPYVPTIRSGAVVLGADNRPFD